MACLSCNHDNRGCHCYCEYMSLSASAWNLIISIVIPLITFVCICDLHDAKNKLIYMYACSYIKRCVCVCMWFVLYMYVRCECIEGVYGVCMHAYVCMHIHASLWRYQAIISPEVLINRHNVYHRTVESLHYYKSYF